MIVLLLFALAPPNPIRTFYQAEIDVPPICVQLPEDKLLEHAAVAGDLALTPKQVEAIAVVRGLRKSLTDIPSRLMFEQMGDKERIVGLRDVLSDPLIDLANVRSSTLNR